MFLAARAVRLSPLGFWARFLRRVLKRVARTLRRGADQRGCVVFFPRRRREPPTHTPQSGAEGGEGGGIVGGPPKLSDNLSVLMSARRI